MNLWQKTKSSILFITHDISEAVLLSDRIYVLSERPAKIIKEIKISLPRPRKLEDLANKNALKIEKQLIDLLLKDNEIE
jgi:ABC-type nitrate/sulfonate/bicarbonate transport system ATPase subunit